MTTAAADKPFARVCLHPGSTWVIRVGRPLQYPFGVAYGELQLAYEAGKARIYDMETAIELRDNLRRLFPQAKLEPATFEQWIEQEAG